VGFARYDDAGIANCLEPTFGERPVDLPDAATTDDASRFTQRRLAERVRRMAVEKGKEKEGVMRCISHTRKEDVVLHTLTLICGCGSLKISLKWVWEGAGSGCDVTDTNSTKIPLLTGLGSGKHHDTPHKPPPLYPSLFTNNHINDTQADYCTSTNPCECAGGASAPRDYKCSSSCR